MYLRSFLKPWGRTASQDTPQMGQDGSNTSSTSVTLHTHLSRASPWPPRLLCPKWQAHPLRICTAALSGSYSLSASFSGRLQPVTVDGQRHCTSLRSPVDGVVAHSNFASKRFFVATQHNFRKCSTTRNNCKM